MSSVVNCFNGLLKSYGASRFGFFLFSEYFISTAEPDLQAQREHNKIYFIFFNFKGSVKYQKSMVCAPVCSLWTEGVLFRKNQYSCKSSTTIEIISGVLLWMVLTAYALINLSPAPGGPRTSGDWAGDVHFASVTSLALTPLKSRHAGHKFSVHPPLCPSPR